MKDLIYYFAYGSNLFIRQFASRVGYYGDVVEGIPYILDGWKLSFNVAPDRGENVKTAIRFANIIPDDGAAVEGVLYKMSHLQFMAMDKYEVLYDRKYFIAQDLPNEPLIATYIAYPEFVVEPGAPTLEYLNRLLDGAKAYNLVDTYNMLVDFKTKNYKLKGGNRHKPIIINEQPTNNSNK